MSITDITLAYLAGAMDSDGYFTIKKSTYHQRVRGDAKNPVYSEKIGLKQVTPQVPHLLKECFGGICKHTNPPSANNKPLWVYTATDKNAAIACELLLPFLRIKPKQAEALLELRESKSNQYEQLSYWFNLEYPHWRDMELITTDEAHEILGYTHSGSTRQAIHNGTLLAIDAYKFRKGAPRIPKLLVEQLANSGSRVKPSQLIDWRERIYQSVREMNKIGVNGTTVYFRTGVHKPAE